MQKIEIETVDEAQERSPGIRPDHVGGAVHYSAGGQLLSFALIYYIQPVYSSEVAIKSGNFRDLMLETS